MSEFKYFKNFVPSSEQTRKQGHALDNALDNLCERKGLFWTALIEYAAVTKMLSGTMLSAQAGDVLAHAGGKLLCRMIEDKYGEADADDKMQELMDDAQSVIGAVLVASGLEQQS